MKSLVCTTPGNLEYQEIKKPQLQKGYSLLKIRRIGICGTDLHAFEGTQPFFEYPRILGHELAAEFVAGDAEGFSPGEAVTIIPYFNCGHCIACRNGQPNCCVNLQVFGVHCHGGMVEYITVPSYSLLHGKGLSFDELAMVENLAIGAHSVQRASIQPGEFVLIVGSGPIGIGIIEFVRIAGGKPIVSDINENRLSFCRDQLKIPFTINAKEEDVAQRLREITNRDMPTVIIDATGSLKAINNGFQYMAHGGRYILVGLQKGDLSVPHPEFHKREATLMSSRNATKEDFIRVIKSIKDGLLNPVNYITHRVSFAKAKEEFASYLLPEKGVIKAMIEV